MSTRSSCGEIFVASSIVTLAILDVFTSEVVFFFFDFDNKKVEVDDKDIVEKKLYQFNKVFTTRPL